MVFVSVFFDLFVHRVHALACVFFEHIDITIEHIVLVFEALQWLFELSGHCVEVFAQLVQLCVLDGLVSNFIALFRLVRDLLDLSLAIGLT